MRLGAGGLNDAGVILHMQHAGTVSTVYNGEHVGIARDRHQLPGILAVIHGLDFVFGQHQALSLVFDVVGTVAHGDEVEAGGCLVIISLVGDIAQCSILQDGEDLVCLLAPAALHLHIGIAHGQFHARLAQEGDGVELQLHVFRHPDGEKLRSLGALGGEDRLAEAVLRNGNGEGLAGAVSQDDFPLKGIAQSFGQAVEQDGIGLHRLVKAQPHLIAGAGDSAEQLRHGTEAAGGAGEVGVQRQILGCAALEFALELQLAEVSALTWVLGHELGPIDIAGFQFHGDALRGGGHIFYHGAVAEDQGAGDVPTVHHSLTEAVGLAEAHAAVGVLCCGLPDGGFVLLAVDEAAAVPGVGLVKGQPVIGDAGDLVQIGDGKFLQIPPLIVGSESQFLNPSRQAQLGGDGLIFLPASGGLHACHGAAAGGGSDAHAIGCAHLVAAGHFHGDLIDAGLGHVKGIVKPLVKIGAADVIGFIENAGGIFPVGGGDGDRGILSHCMAILGGNPRDIQVIHIPGVLVVHHPDSVTTRRELCRHAQGHIALPVLGGGEGTGSIGDTVDEERGFAAILLIGHAQRHAVVAALAHIEVELHILASIKIADITTAAAAVIKQVAIGLGFLSLIAEGFVRSERRAAARHGDVVQVPGAIRARNGRGIHHLQGVFPLRQHNRNGDELVIRPAAGVGDGETLRRGAVHSEGAGAVAILGGEAQQDIIGSRLLRRHFISQAVVLKKVAHIGFAAAIVGGAVLDHVDPAGGRRVVFRLHQRHLVGRDFQARCGRRHSRQAQQHGQRKQHGQHSLLHGTIPPHNLSYALR